MTTTMHHHTLPGNTDTHDIPALSPLDEFNTSLRDNVHPPSWNNPKPSGRYNLVVIGAGAAGLVTAAGAAGLGAKVALVERSLLGGDCLNVGCVPSKALIRSARAAADAREAGTFGVDVSGQVSVDFAAVMQRMRRLRSGIAPHDSAERFRDMGIDVFIGQATFKRPGIVRVGEQDLPYARAVIATGARAAIPPVPGLDEAGYLTNETVFSLTELPKRLAIIGAGPIGCELAQSFARFGSQVTLIDSTSGILNREDEEAAGMVQAALERDGVRVVCGGKAARVSRSGSEKTIELDCEGTQHHVVCDEILVAVGRAPNIEGLGLEAVGVDYDKRAGVTVDDRLRTTNRDIYACGDICSRFKFTHAADAMARIVIQNALLFGRAKASALTMPWCTYTDPEVAHVGLYEKDAKEQGVAYDAYRIDMKSVDRAILDGQTTGFLKVLTRKGTDKILGATLVASHAGDLLAPLVLAMTNDIGLGKIAKTIHAYPTQAEVIKKAGDAYSRTRLTPLVKNVFEKVLAWRR